MAVSAWPMTSSVRTFVNGRSPSCRNWRLRNCTCCRSLSWLEWHILGASLRRMGVLATTIYAREALFAYTIPGCGLTTEQRAIRGADRRTREGQGACLFACGLG